MLRKMKLLKYLKSASVLVICFVANAALADNLSTCLTGKYPSLCDKSKLTDGQRQQSIVAERSENLKTCMSGKYPILCKKNLLSTNELEAVNTAERRENLATCSTGKYPILCKRELLNAEERSSVISAEIRENLATCLTGRYRSLCNKKLLTAEQKTLTEAAEKRFQQTVPAPIPARRRGSSGCESGHWVQDVMSNGEFVKLEDGSVWEIDGVDQIDTMLWLPTTDIIACPDKLINTDDNETVGARRIR
jgi:hypothetical protein